MFTTFESFFSSISSELPSGRRSVFEREMDELVFVTEAGVACRKFGIAQQFPATVDAIAKHVRASDNAWVTYTMTPNKPVITRNSTIMAQVYLREFSLGRPVEEVIKIDFAKAAKRFSLLDREDYSPAIGESAE